MAVLEEMDDTTICVEVIFEQGDIPYERHLIGSVGKLSEVLSVSFLEKRAREANADSAYVQNVYFRTRQTTGTWRSEFRLGNQSDSDMEAFIMKGDLENE